MPKIKDLGIKVIPETIRPPEIGPGGGCTDCTVQAFSICGGTQQMGGGGCTDCTVQAFSICGGTHQCACTNITNPCFGCTANLTVVCPLHTINPCGALSGCHCTWNSPCLCTHLGSIPCRFGSGGCGFSPVCGGSIDPTIVQQPQQQLTREQIAALKDQLQKQIEALDAHAKTLGPKTSEEIDAREKALNEELAQLKARRKELK